MKHFATFALVVLSCAPATAQFGGGGGMGGGMAVRPMTLAQTIELDILEMEQEADKSALRKALVLQASQGMTPNRGNETETKMFAEDAATLRDFIEKKKDAITKRATEMADKRSTAMRAPVAVRASQPPEGDKNAAIEAYEKGKIEVQLLQAQITLLQEPLETAIQALAKAELDASNDEFTLSGAEAARKKYDKIKAKVVDLSKQLRQEQQLMLPMQMQMQRMGMGGGGVGGFQ